MKTVRLTGLLIVACFAVNAAFAQLMKIDYAGTFDHIDRTTGKPYPDWVPVPFEAQALVDLRSAMDVVRHDEYTEFTPRVWDQEGTRSMIRWRAYNEEIVRPATTIRVWDNGRFDIANFDRMTSLTLSLFLSAPLDSDRIPVPPFSFAMGPSNFGQVTGRYVLRGGFFLGSFTSVTAELVPVPEPATYGGAAAALLTLLIVRRPPQRLPSAS